MENNKVMLKDGTTIIDLTEDTVTADDVAVGKTFHDKSGASVVGTAQIGGENLDEMEFGEMENPPEIGTTNGQWYEDIAEAVGIMEGIIPGTIVDRFIADAVPVLYDSETTFLPSYAFFSYSTLTAVFFPKCTTIGSYAFGNCFALKYVSFPVCETIESGFAFASCNALKSVFFPACKTIGSYGFYTAKLKYASFPVCESIQTCAFLGCTSLVDIYAPECTYIGGATFSNCYNLLSVNFPKCSYIGTSAFSLCSRMEEAAFSQCERIMNQAFYQCTNLKSVSFPICSLVSNAAFYQCSKLMTISLPECTEIGGSAFGLCWSLMSLYLLGSTIVTLTSSNAFTSTPLYNNSLYTGRYGSIYVPTSLRASYRTATNWTYVSTRIVGV